MNFRINVFNSFFLSLKIQMFLSLKANSAHLMKYDDAQNVIWVFTVWNSKHLLTFGKVCQLLRMLDS